MPQFFFFPAYPANLLRIFGLSLLGAVAFFLPQSFLSVLLLVLLIFMAWVSYFRYSYHVLYMTSQGHLSPADYPLFHKREDDMKPYKQMLVFILLGFTAGWVMALFGPILGYVYLLIVVFGLPASIMIVSLENSVLSPLNPLKTLRIMATIGWPYLTMFAFLFLLYASQGIAAQWLAKAYAAKVTQSPGLMVFAINFVMMYFTLIMYNMIGYVLYQYHDELGLSVTVTQDQQLSSESKIGEWVATGNLAAALELAQSELAQNLNDVSVNDRYFKLLLLSDTPQRAINHAHRYLALLMKNKQSGKAVQVFEQILTIAPEFRLEEADQVLPMAQAAQNIGKSKLAMRIMNKFDQHFPGNPQIPLVYFMGAKLLCEEFNDYAGARKIIQGLLRKFPDHYLVNEVQNYQQLLDNLEKS